MTRKVFQFCGLIVVFFIFAVYPAIGQIPDRKEDVADTPFLRGCPKNSDPRFDRQLMLKKLNRILKKRIPYYDEFPLMGYFVFDLTDPSNSYLSERHGLGEAGCINFINNHVYHFSAGDLDSSKSQIAILEDGKLKVFNSINCGSKDKLDDVLEYVSRVLKEGKNKDDTITRLKHYRRYGIYQTVDSTAYSCNKEVIPENSDRLYSRSEMLQQFLQVLVYSRPSVFQRGFPFLFIEESRAVGFFIYDLVEPSNRQTSLLERVEFKNNHVYHFAHIDLPFSFSNIAVLEDGYVRIFRTINCDGKGDSLNEVISYLNEKFKGDKNKDQIIERVNNYRRYGIYAPLNGLSTPQCKLVK